MLRSLDSTSRVSPEIAAWLSSIVRTIYPQGSCRHPEWRLCERRQKKVTSFRIQCLECGRVSSSIAREKVYAAGVSTAALPAWDENLLESNINKLAREEADRRLREEERFIDDKRTLRGNALWSRELSGTSHGQNENDGFGRPSAQFSRHRREHVAHLMPAKSYGHYFSW